MNEGIGVNEAKNEEIRRNCVSDSKFSDSKAERRQKCPQTLMNESMDDME